MFSGFGGLKSAIELTEPSRLRRGLEQAVEALLGAMLDDIPPPGELLDLLNGS